MYIGLDIGTSGCKAAVMDASGKILGSCGVSYSMNVQHGGIRELDEELVFAGAMKCVSRVAAGRDVRSITVSSLGEAVIPIDADGNSLHRGIIGSDLRGEEEAGTLVRKLGPLKLSEITGQHVSSIYSLPKEMWLANNVPGLADRVWKYLSFQSYMIYRLCGAAVIDHSLAARTLAFDIESLRWSDAVLGAAGIPRSAMPDAVRPGTCVGMLKESICKEIGSRNVKVIAGAHDHICNAIGSGISRVGECAMPCGTTEGFTVVMPHGSLKAETIASCQISKQPYLIPGLENTIAWQNTAGAAYKWFASLFGPEESHTDFFRDCEEKMPPKPSSVMVMPHFSGCATPYNDSQSRAAFLGIGLETDRYRLYRAIIEGVAFEDAMILGTLKKAGIPISRICCTGGTATDRILQIKADVLRTQIYRPAVKNTGPFGNALLGAVEDGCFDNIAEAAETVTYDRVFEPSASDYYAERVELYGSLYETLKKANHTLSSL